MSSRITVALAGNPNCGKTTLFNRLTGARQHVGNYPGVTVEKKEGLCRHGDAEITLIDLPGTYSLTAYSTEELVARNFIINEHPDVVVDILDASSIERHLYLAVQLMELGVPLVLALNMSDVAKARGIDFDLPRLSTLLGAPIVPTVGSKGEGVTELLDAVLRVHREGQGRRFPLVNYGRDVEAALDTLQGALRGRHAFADERRERWTAVKLLENDCDVLQQIAEPEIRTLAEESQAALQALLGDTPEMTLADRRYGFISGACQEAVRTTAEIRHSLSDRIDAVVTHPMFGVPVFLGMMYLVFQATFVIGRVPMRGLEALFAWLAHRVASAWPAGFDSVWQSLVVDGILGGVGGVLVFLPNILLLFLAIAILEDSGYMARAAFITDHLMHRIGLHGKSFIPMLIGFGCSVPAILSTRMLDNRRDRLATMMVLPLISCGARLPIYTLIIPAFFPPALHAPMLWMMYLIGIGLAIGGAKLLRVTVLKGENTGLVIELPPYRLPTMRSLLLHMWERGGMYLRKAGTVILGFSIVLWALTTFPKVHHRAPGLTPEQHRAMEIEHTFTGRIGHALEPLLRPMGFDWRIGTALVGALAGKEMFVAQLGIVYAVDAADEDSPPLAETLRRHYSPLVGFCILLFTLISMPCVATVACIRKESGAWRWAVLQAGALTALAWVLTTAVYQVGRLAGLSG